MPSKENIVGVCVGCSSALVRTISAEIVKKSGCIVHPITCKKIKLLFRLRRI